jgi:hypothetical protein
MGAFPEGNYIGVSQITLENVLEGYRVSTRKQPMINDLEKRLSPPVLF